ncbi:MAG: hypothetical protein AAFV53_37960 [Myxococcota bacterium]
MCDENISWQVASAFQELKLPVYSFRDFELRAVPDPVWIPMVGQQRIRIFTSDKRIKRDRQERPLYEKFRVGLFTVPQVKPVHLAQILLWRWGEIKEAAAGEGPFHYQFTRSAQMIRRAWSVECPTLCGKFAYMRVINQSKKIYEGRCSCGWRYDQNTTPAATVGLPR